MQLFMKCFFKSCLKNRRSQPNSKMRPKNALITKKTKKWKYLTIWLCWSKNAYQIYEIFQKNRNVRLNIKPKINNFHFRPLRKWKSMWAELLQPARLHVRVRLQRRILPLFKWIHMLRFAVVSSVRSSLCYPAPSHVHWHFFLQAASFWNFHSSHATAECTHVMPLYLNFHSAHAVLPQLSLRGGWGSNPCSTNFVANFVLFWGLL